MSKLALFVFCTALLAAGTAAAKPGDAAKGKEIYEKRCGWCHGAEGDGAGAAKDLLNPPPRDFTSGNYKIKSSSFEDMVPNDDDIFRMIRDGMPGTAMPGWGDVLKERDMWNLVAYLKTFAGYDKPPEKQVDFGKQVASSAESIAKGKKLFEEGDRCVECHGKSGKGSASKRLKGEAGERTWPRNLTKPWTYRGGSDPKDIFARISTGIAGTEMPSFADPKSKKSLTAEERWYVANYVASLAETGRKVAAENTVVKADRVEGDLPETTDDVRWEKTEAATFYLVPQLIAEERFFTPSNDTITVRALYNDKAIAILLEWDDRTRSIPGDEAAEKLADPPIAEDGVAVQLPVTVTKGMAKPYFGMGDASRPVNIWQWKSGTKDAAESIHLANSRGFKEIERRDAAEVGLKGRASYGDGTWKVLMMRPLATPTPAQDIQFAEGKFIPIAFAAWDGSNGEKGAKHTMTTWYWLLLKPATGYRPLIAALLVMALAAGGLLWWARSAKPAA
ncbi:ethylbenzene dehydrogenase-related protein [Candidatus Ferrigenium straubiae]|uniref:ethylbenzene dehydrogenase-related protein n=1 Tax=Candidatus Ferrigenium straubiae TaxID=2919506 RepID=UPI003F4AA2B7